MALLTKRDTLVVMEKLAKQYPEARCELNFTTPFELLIATMLSAQCTDVRVNMVTERLFAKYHHPADFARVSIEELQEDIRDVGLFRMKAQHIIATSQQLLDRYDGEVPSTREQLIELPGVGRKTANVVLSNAFHIPAFAVDTHVLRVSNRIGLADGDSPEDVEQQVCRRVPKDMWIDAHHRLIFHGRRICVARKPKCDVCPLQAECRYYKKIAKRSTTS